MLNKYTELFRELYEHKFYENRSPKNSFEKVQLLQRKMHNKNHHKKENSLTNSALCLKDVNEDQSKKFIREIMKGNKKPSTHHGIRRPLWINPNQESFLPLKDRRLSQTAGKTHRSQTQRVHPDRNNEEVNDFSIYEVYHRIKLQRFLGKKNVKEENKPRGKTSSERRAKTPSKNVVIGGRNLEMQAEEYRKQFRKIDKQIEKYQQQITSRDGSPKPLTHRRKVIRYEKQIPMQKKIRVKINQEKKQEKEENIDLRPWAVFPLDHQYY